MALLHDMYIDDCLHYTIIAYSIALSKSQEYKLSQDLNRLDQKRTYLGEGVHVPSLTLGACAARVTVVCLCVSVCLSMLYSPLGRYQYYTLTYCARYV